MRLTRQQLEQWLQALNNLAQDPGVVLGLSDVMEELDQLLPPDQQFRELPLPTGGSIGALDDEDTLDLLAAAGIQYVCDWVSDDQPFEIGTATRPLVVIPYTVEINDIPMMVVQHHTADELFHRGSRVVGRA